MTLVRQNSINNKCDALKKLREIYDKTSLLWWNFNHSRVWISNVRWSNCIG